MIAKRLKKYLFLISIIFLVLTSIHLVYSYFYSDAKETPIKWWTISEGIIGKVPSLNPLKADSSNNKYINSILYRSLLKFDIKQNKIIWDLAKCDIENLLSIECFLDTNAKWSNWEKITKKDVIKTFQIIKNSGVNPIISSLLKDTTIEEKDSSIIFKSTKRDINILNIFFQPIVSESVLNRISKKELDWNFSLWNSINSWEYKLTNISQDETSRVTTITLEKNEEFYKNPVYIDKILFKVFENSTDLLKMSDVVNIFNDKNSIIWDSIPRLKEYSYTLPQYVGLFMNSVSMNDKNIRAWISEAINRDELLEELWKEKYKWVENPFVSNIYVEKKEINPKNIKELLSLKWYLSKEELENNFEDELSKINKSIESLSEETKTFSNEVKVEEKPKVVKKEIEQIIQNSKSKIFFFPEWVDKYNFVTKTNFLLKATVSEWVDSIYINETKLESFKKWNKSFSYNVNLKSWRNDFKIYFEKSWKKELADEITFFQDNDKNVLKQKEAETMKQKVIIEEIVSNWTWTVQKEKNMVSTIQKIKQKNLETKKSIEEKLTKLKSLDKSYLYNKSLETFKLRLISVWEDEDFIKTTNYLTKVLKENWIELVVKVLKTDWLADIVLWNKKDYDVMLIWVNLGYFKFNIFPYFHSSQISSWYNFSNYKKPSLDIILDELRSSKISEDRTKELEKNALNIINSEYIVKTLYTPIISNLVDKDIKWYSLAKEIPDDIYRFEELKKSYIKESKTIVTENKSFKWFFVYIFETLF